MRLTDFLACLLALICSGARAADPPSRRTAVGIDGEKFTINSRVNGYRPMPILFNEDDHYDFDKPANNFLAALDEYASWGFFDYRRRGESFNDGYQSVPVNWGITSQRKKAFFELASEITGANQ